jgi:phosphinothricin acetyltransferase
MEFRLAAAADAAGMAEIYAPIVASTPTSFEIDPPDAPEMRRRIDATLPTLPWLVCDCEGRVAGYAYASPHKTRAAYKWSVDTSVYVHSAFHRRGIGTALYKLLFEILTAQGYFNAYAGVTLPNPGSVGLHESLGFQRVGVYRRVGYKLGEWHDVGWWQRPLRRSDEVPGPTLALGDLQNHPSWHRLLTSGRSSGRH